MSSEFIARKFIKIEAVIKDKMENYMRKQKQQADAIEHNVWINLNDNAHNESVFIYAVNVKNISFCGFF